MSTPEETDHHQVDLVGLLAGETDREETTQAVRHLGTCDRCTAELVALVGANAALRSAARAGHELGTVPAVPAVPAVHRGEVAGPGPGPVDRGEALPPLDLTSPVRRESGRPDIRRRVLVAAAAVVVLLVAVGAGLALSHRGGPAGTVVAQAPLHPMAGPPDASGTLTAVADGGTRQLTVETSALADPAPGSFYEVWLLDPATLKMLAVGVLPPSGTGTYDMGADIMAGYSAVDVSLQADDGNPAHSSTSVLRGTF